MRTGLAVIGALVAISFFNIWWLCVIGSVTCTVLAGLLERENFRLRDEVDRLTSELAQRDTGQAPDHEPPDAQAQQRSDAFLQRLQRLGAPKRSI